MAYSKQTWTDGVNGGTPITAARLQHIEDGVANAAVVSDFAKAHLYQSTVQPFSTAAWQTVTLDTALIDSHGGLASGGFKVPAGQAGIYLVDGSFYAHSTAGAGTYGSSIWVNGGARPGAESGGSTYFPAAGYALGVAAGARLLNLVVGDLLSLAAYSTLTTWDSSTNVRSWMTVLRVA